VSANANVITGMPSNFYLTLGSLVDGNTAAETSPGFTQYTRNTSGFLSAIDPRPSVLNTTITAGAPITAAYRGAFGTTNWASGWTRLSTAGILQGGGSGMADADSDGVSDTVEAANTALGFNSAVSDATSVLGTLKTTAQFNANYTAGQNQVKNNPALHDLYTAASILEVRTTAGVTVQAGAEDVTLSVPVQKSTGLGSWENIANPLTLTIPKTAGKEFYRLEVQGAN